MAVKLTRLAFLLAGIIYMVLLGEMIGLLLR